MFFLYIHVYIDGMIVQYVHMHIVPVYDIYTCTHTVYVLIESLKQFRYMYSVCEYPLAQVW